MKKIIITFLVLIPLVIIGATKIGDDSVIFSKYGSDTDKELRFGSQFRVKTSSDTSELLLSVDSGSNYYALLTASTGGGGGSGLITSTASPSTDRAAVVWDGTSGNQLTETSVLIDLLNGVTGVGSLTLSSSVTLGSNSYIYADGNGNVRCSADSGTNTNYLCGVDTPSITGATSVSPCQIKLTGANGSVGAVKYFATTTVNSCGSGAVTFVSNGSVGSVLTINTEGIYYISCGIAAATTAGFGLVRDSYSNSLNNTFFLNLNNTYKLGSSHVNGTYGMDTADAIVRLPASTEITCQISSGMADVGSSTHFFLFIEHIR